MDTLDLIACCTPITRRRLDDRQAEELETVFKALADRHRIKIVNLLVAAKDAVCVCDLVDSLRLKQPTVSYHLKQLSDAGIIRGERRGTYSFYELSPGALERVASLLGMKA